MNDEQAAVEVSEPTVPVRRLHVSLRSFFVLITFIALGFAFVSAYGGGGDAWILLFLIGIGPLSVWIEYQLSKPIWDRTVGSLKRTKRRAWAWLAFALGPLSIVAVWWVHFALEIDWVGLLTNAPAK